MGVNRKITFTILIITSILAYSVFSNNQYITYANPHQGVTTTTTSSPSKIHAPLSTPPICEQPVPYRVVTPDRVIPENPHRIFFEFCNNYNNYYNFDPELEIRVIDTPDSNWTNIEFTTILYTNVVSDTLEEWSYVGEFYFESCSAIEGRFRFLSLETLQPQTNWRTINIPLSWECGPSNHQNIDLVGLGIIGFGTILLIGGIYSVASMKKYFESKPEIQRYNQFVKLRNIPKNQIQQKNNIEKKYRIVKSGIDSVELYKKDGRKISDQDFQEILNLKEEINDNSSE